MLRTRYSGFVEVFNCLTVLESNFAGMTVGTVLKVPFEKAARLPPLPFQRSGTPAWYVIRLTKERINLTHK